MAVDPESFVLDIPHTKQKIEQLEEQIAKEDASQQTTSEHHATGGRLKILLGQHLQAIQKEEHDHVAMQTDLEAQIATLKACIALQDRLFAGRSAANEALREQLGAKVDSFNGPAYRLNQLKAEEAIANIRRITEDAFSKQWLEQTGIAPLMTPEIIQTFIAKAMTVAQQAQTMGIRITPPATEGSTAGPPVASSNAQVMNAGAGSSAGAGANANLPANATVGATVPATAATNEQIPLSPQFVPGAFSQGAPNAAPAVANA